MIKTVALYVRVSTDEQIKYGVSIEAQEQELKKYCMDHKYKIFKVYKDEGISASTIKQRKALVELLNNLDNFDLVLFTKLDRLSRNVLDANNIVQLFNEHNVSFKAILEDDLETETADGRFLFNLKVNLAEREKNKVSERIKDVNKYKREIAKTSCSGKVPFGYKLDEDKKIIIDKDKSKIVNQMFNEFLTTGSISKTWQWYISKYDKVDYHTILRRLKTKAYIGKFERKTGEIIDNYCPPIIDETTFNQTQKLLEYNNKIYKTKNGKYTAEKTIFNQLLKCPYCGYSLSYTMNKNGNVYYQCRNRKKCESKAFLSEIRLEKYLLNNLPIELEKLKIEHKNIVKISDKQLIKQKEALNGKIARLNELYVEGNINHSYYKESLDKIKKELASLNEKQVPVDIESIKKLLDQNVLEIYNTLSKQEKKVFWRSIVSSIIVKSTDELIINFMKGRS